jgi:elongation factor P
MAKVSTSDFRNGLNFYLDGEIYTIVEFQHVKPGKGPAFVRTKLKGVVNNKTIDKTFRSGETVESLRVERHKYQFLYRDGDMFHMMDQETYEQFGVESAKVRNQVFLNEGEIANVMVDGDKDIILYAEPLDHINVEISYTEPGVKGDTAQGGTKPAQIAAGATIQVPLFINIGDKVRIDTRTGTYIERAK